MTKIKSLVVVIVIFFLLSVPRDLAAQTLGEPNFQSQAASSAQRKQIANAKLEQNLTKNSADNIGHALAVFAIFACLAMIRKQ